MFQAAGWCAWCAGTGDETIQRLLDVHEGAATLAAVEQYQGNSPQGPADYLSEAKDLSAVDALITDEWSTE